VEDRPGDEVGQGILESQAEYHGQHRRGGQQRSDIDPEQFLEQDQDQDDIDQAHRYVGDQLGDLDPLGREPGQGKLLEHADQEDGQQHQQQGDQPLAGKLGQRQVEVGHRVAHQLDQQGKKKDPNSFTDDRVAAAEETKEHDEQQQDAAGGECLQVGGHRRTPQRKDPFQ